MRFAVAISFLVLVTVIGGSLSTAAADDGRRLVEVQCTMLDSVQDSLQSTLLLSLGVKVLHVISFAQVCALGVQLLDLGILGDLSDLVDALLRISGVVAIRYDPLGSLTLIDTILPEGAPSPGTYDWGMEQILVPEVHEDDLQGSGVTVAIMDTGIDTSHPEFKNAQGFSRITKGFNAVAGEGGGCNEGTKVGAYGDNNGHGTHVAGIVAAKGEEIFGAAPKVNLMAVKVLNKDAQGYLSDFLCGLQWVYKQNVHLVNMSVGFWNDKGLLKKAIESLFQNHVIMVAAAGNKTGSDPSCVSGFEGGGVDDGDGDGEEESISCNLSSDNVMYPAKYHDWVIGVAATKYNDANNPLLTQITDYSRYDKEIAVAAPGGQKNDKRILSTGRKGSYALSSGTSQATAHVTGALALALNNKPTLGFQEALDKLQATAWDLDAYSEPLNNLKLINVQSFVGSLQ